MDSKEYAKECQDIKEDIKKKNDQLNDINAKIAEYAMIKHINDRVDETVNFANSLSESIEKVYDHLISLTDKMIKYSHHMKELELRIVDLENQLKKKEEDNI